MAMVGLATMVGQAIVCQEGELLGVPGGLLAVALLDEARIAPVAVAVSEVRIFAGPSDRYYLVGHYLHTDKHWCLPL
jgi:hypothetical protein